MATSRRMWALVVAALLVAGVSQTVASARPVPGPKWHVQSSPTFDASSVLQSVTTLRATQTWAVGYAEDHQHVLRTLIEHFDGDGWSRQVSPDPGPPDDELTGVKAVSSSNVWAVGEYTPSAGGVAGMILHYDGSNWSIAELQPAAAYFSAVAVHGAGDAWSVGRSADVRTYIEHYDGASWARQPTPGKVGDDLTAVSAASSSSVWAVGRRSPLGGITRPLILHDGGSGWHVQSAPPLPDEGVLEGVSAVSPNDVWAVGWYLANGSGDVLILHWDGHVWTQFPPPEDGAVGTLYAVKATASDDVWAVGSHPKDGSTKTLIEHWNGSSWKVVGSPNGGGNTTLLGVASSGANNSFAVGFVGIQSKARTFVAHCAC